MVNDAMNPDTGSDKEPASCFLLSSGQKQTLFTQSDGANPHANDVARLLFVCWVPALLALYLCYPVRRWCHSWGEAMIKILLSV